MWQFQILPSNISDIAPRPANCAGVCMTSREARIYKYEEPWGLGWRIWPRCSKSNFILGTAELENQIAFQWMKFLQSVQKKYRGQKDPQGNTPWEATAFSESFGQRPPVFFQKKQGVSCLVHMHQIDEHPWFRSMKCQSRSELNDFNSNIGTAHAGWPHVLMSCFESFPQRACSSWRVKSPVVLKTTCHVKEV